MTDFLEILIASKPSHHRELIENASQEELNEIGELILNINKWTITLQKREEKRLVPYIQVLLVILKQKRRIRSLLIKNIGVVAKLLQIYMRWQKEQTRKSLSK